MNLRQTDREPRDHSVPDLPPLARAKLILLTYGINVDVASLYNLYGRNLVGYKRKTALSVPRLQKDQIVEAVDKSSHSIPSEIKISRDRKGSIVKVVFDPHSPYLLTADSEQCFILDRLSNRIDLDVELCREERTFNSRVSGYPLSDFVSLIGKDRISVLLYWGCQNWLSRNQCKFCNLFALPRSRNSIVPNICDIGDKFSGNTHRWWASVKNEYYGCLKRGLERVITMVRLAPHTHLCVMAGNMGDLSFQWKIAIELGKVVNEVIPLSQCDSYLNIMATRDRNMIEKAREIGFRNVQLNLEVLGESYYRKVCPGKAKTTSYKDFMNSLRWCASIFGAGRARTNLVLGIQPLDRVKKGVIKLARDGIVTDYTVFIPKKGTPLWASSPPSIDKVADFTSYLADIYREYGFRPIYCALSSRSSIMNECFYS